MRGMASRFFTASGEHVAVARLLPPATFAEGAHLPAVVEDGATAVGTLCLFSMYRYSIASSSFLGGLSSAIWPTPMCGTFMFGFRTSSL